MSDTGQTRPIRLGGLKKRQEFLALRKARAQRFPAFMLVSKMTRDPAHGEARLGLTVTKKTGCAVERNRIKRRLRAAAREIFPAYAEPGVDYILIAHKKALHCKYDQLLDDLKRALLRTAKSPK